MSIPSLEETPEEQQVMTDMAGADAQPAAPAAPVSPAAPTPPAPAADTPPGSTPTKPDAAATPADPPAPAQPVAPAAPTAPQQPQRVVPHAALHEERTKRQAVERELADLKARLGQVAAPAAPAAPAQPGATGGEVPDETTDPIGTLGWLKNVVLSSQQQTAEQIAEQNRINELAQQVKARIDPYAAAHPEYKDQLAFVRLSRANELKLVNPGISDQAIEMQVMREEMVLGQQAVANDWDLGQMVANLAAHRGWKPGEPAPASAPAPATQPTPAERIDNLARGLKAAVSPSKGGGEAPVAGDISLEQLAELEGDEFDHTFDKEAKRIFG